MPGDLAQLFPGSGQVYKPAIVVPGSDSAVRISRLHGPHFKSDTLKIVDDPRNRNPIFGVVLDLNVDKIHARFQFEVGKGVAVYELLARHQTCLSRISSRSCLLTEFQIHTLVQNPRFRSDQR